MADGLVASLPSISGAYELEKEMLSDVSDSLWAGRRRCASPLDDREGGKLLLSCE